MPQTASRCVAPRNSAASCTAAQKSAPHRLVNVAFAGSPRSIVTALLKLESWTDDELDAVSAEIKRARNDGEKEP